MRKLSAFAGTFLALLVFGTSIAFSAKHTLELTQNSFYELGKNPGYIPDGERIRPALLGFDHFAADLYWLRAVQYTGSNTGGFEFNALPQYLDLVTDLDPHFLHAYHFGALVYTLNEHTTDDVVPLLQKGIRENEGKDGLGQIYVDLAYFTYFYWEQYEKAAELYDVCAEQIKDCPIHAARTARSLRGRTGKYSLALEKWMNQYAENTEEKSTEELDIEEKRIEESAKMVALSCAIKNYTLSGKTIQRVEDLIGQNVYPCPDFSSLAEGYKKYLFSRNSEYGLITVTQETITNPFAYAPFEWNSEKKRITAGRYWQ